METFDNNPSVSVIVPVHNGGPEFRMCLESVQASTITPDEIIVLADGDTDKSYDLALEFATEVLKTATPIGPARGRNMAARKANGDLLFFIDADIAIPRNAIKRVVEAFKEDSCLTAVFGSYDDQPFQSNFMSQYKNLFHHYIHQTSNAEASTFWSGCGAIRRDIFFKMDGFDERYHRPCIEDIELGYRLRNAGYRIRLLKSLQVKHLKRWGFFSLVKTDIFYRAIPWSYLIFRQGSLVHDLNLKIQSRICVILVYLLAFLLLGVFYLPWLSIPLALVAMVLLWLNQDLYTFFFKKRGLYFVIRLVPYHWLYYFYSGAAFAVVLAYCGARSGFLRRFQRKPRRDRPNRIHLNS